MLFSGCTSHQSVAFRGQYAREFGPDLPTLPPGADGGTCRNGNIGLQSRGMPGALDSSILLCSKTSILEFLTLLGKEFMLNYMQEYLGSVV